MNRKSLFAGLLALAVGGASVFAQGAESKEKGSDAGCPMHVSGAKVSVVKIDSGVVIHVTGGDAAAVSRIQAAAAGIDRPAAAKGGCKHCAGHSVSRPAAEASKAGVYACSMGDYAGPRTKDGLCPKCGMSLTLKK